MPIFKTNWERKMYLNVPSQLQISSGAPIMLDSAYVVRGWGPVPPCPGDSGQGQEGPARLPENARRTRAQQATLRLN